MCRVVADFGTGLLPLGTEVVQLSGWVAGSRVSSTAHPAGVVEPAGPAVRSRPAPGTGGPSGCVSTRTLLDLQGQFGNFAVQRCLRPVARVQRSAGPVTDAATPDPYWRNRVRELEARRETAFD